MAIQGFKSFAKKTDIDFHNGINVFVGPNGGGKSNLMDALCFVLGRLSIKSMRAAKARNLIFIGSKFVKPAREAFVELILDNSDRAFSINKDEISLKRIVRANGQSIYKINDETKTRIEVLEMLAQAGIDPYGFNLIMQGQIQSIVRMHPEDRRRVIEEVAGISVYETRKEKSLRELEKTDERLKEISTILRERTTYLKNLESEKQQAEKFKDAEMTAKRAKASLIHKKEKEKEKEIQSIIKSIEKNNDSKLIIKNNIDEIQNEINEFNNKINEINKSIQKSSGIEQETIHNEIANLKAELEGLRVRKESYENRYNEIEKRVDEMSKSMPEIEAEIIELKKESPLVAQKSAVLQKKKREFNEIENERKKLITLKTELNAIKERIKDKEKQLARINATSESLLKGLEEISAELLYENGERCNKAIDEFKKSSIKKKKEIDKLIKDELANEKLVSINESEILRAEKIIANVEKLDICPLCQSKINEEHKKHVYNDSELIIKNAKEIKKKAERELAQIEINKSGLLKETKDIENKLSKSEIELISHKNIHEKKELIKKAVDEENILKAEIIELEDKRKKMEIKANELDKIEDKYHKTMLEIEEVSSRTAEDVDTILLYKERELENMQNIIKKSREDLKEIEIEINEIGDKIENKSSLLAEKEERENKLNIRFKKLFEDRDSVQVKIQEKNILLSEIQTELRQLEDQINYLKIGKAKLDAEHEALQMEISEFAGIELIQGSVNLIEEKLKKAQEILQNIGSINMRALEVYDQIKKEYDIVYEKVNVLVKEKEDILKIIDEIDRKKKKTFMKTFNAMSNLFSENFSKLFTRGTAYLEIENKEDIFSGGVRIAVKMAKGKYFDVSSLSGGEQTLIALSLLFAIQEYKPYHFYVFDEIDAALDKRNSERLAGLLNQYMKAGQYIVITHNDALITNSNVLYGVSMQDGVSKILSLNIGNTMGNNEQEAKSEQGGKSIQE